MSEIIYLNPSGNITALLYDYKNHNERIEETNQILNKHLAEQVGYNSNPIYNGDYRIEMMGGEFCGNATRAYGFYEFCKNYKQDKGSLLIEISGFDRPLEVIVDKTKNESFVSMPLINHKNIKSINIYLDKNEISLPMISMDGIDHVIFDLSKYNEIYNEFSKNYKKSGIVNSLINNITKNKSLDNSEAIGIMFIYDDKIIPYVEVKEVGSHIWESSCGSGTTAYFAYLLNRIIFNGNYDITRKTSIIHGIYNEDTCSYYYEKTFIEPNGNITLKGEISNHKIIRLLMGGDIKTH